MSHQATETVVGPRLESVKQLFDLIRGTKHNTPIEKWLGPLLERLRDEDEGRTVAWPDSI